MITGTVSYWRDASGSSYDSGRWSIHHAENNTKTYYKCESCGAKYVVPELVGKNLIRLVCSGCGGNLEEVLK